MRGLQVVQQRPQLGIGVARQRFGDPRVREPRVASHHGFVDVCLQRCAGLVEGQIADGAEPVHVGIERTDPVRKPLGKHRQDGAGEIDAGGAPQRLAIEGSAGGHVASDVRDGHHQAVAAGRARDVDGVVEIARVLAVDGHERQVAQVAPAGDLVGVDVVRDALRGDQRRRVELVCESLRIRGSEDLEAGIAAVAQDGDDLALQRSLELAVQPDLDHVAVACARMARDRDVAHQIAVVGDHPLRLSLRLVDPQRELAPALDDLEHFAGEPAVAAAHGARPDHVPVERALRELRRHEEIVFAAAVAEERRDEAVPFRLHVDDAGEFRPRLARALCRPLVAVHARSFDHRRRRATRLRPRRLAGGLAAVGVGAFLALQFAVDVAVVAGAAVLHEIREGAPQPMTLRLPQVELACELLEGESLSLRAT